MSSRTVCKNEWPWSPHEDSERVQDEGGEGVPYYYYSHNKTPRCYRTLGHKGKCRDRRGCHSWGAPDFADVSEVH